MIKANMIKPVASGIILGCLLVFNIKKEKILLERTNHGNCLEIIMPLVQPKDCGTSQVDQKNMVLNYLGSRRNQKIFI